MSFQDRLASQDGLQLLTVVSGLSLASAAAHHGNKYNLPLMLFGIVAFENHSSTVLLRQFLVLTIFSLPLDIWHLFARTQGLTFLVSLLILLLKAPIIFTLLNNLRDRGGELGLAFPGQGGAGTAGFSFGGNRSGPVGLGGAEQGQGGSNWNMPGGFGQGIPTAAAPSSAAPPPPAQFPQSGGYRLGGEESTPATPPALSKGGYQPID